MSGVLPFHIDQHDQVLLEIGRIATTWAKYEHWIDRAIWRLMGVGHNVGACLTTQLGSIHAKHRALGALLIERDRPKTVVDRFGKMEARAHELVKVRNKYAHGPINLGIDFETKEFRVYLENVNVRRAVNVSTDPLSIPDLQKAHDDIGKLLMELIDFWPELVGVDQIPAH